MLSGRNTDRSNGAGEAKQMGDGGSGRNDGAECVGGEHDGLPYGPL